MDKGDQILKKKDDILDAVKQSAASTAALMMSLVDAFEEAISPQFKEHFGKLLELMNAAQVPEYCTTCPHSHLNAHNSQHITRHPPRSCTRSPQSHTRILILRISPSLSHCRISMPPRSAPPVLNWLLLGRHV